MYYAYASKTGAVYMTSSLQKDEAIVFLAMVTVAVGEYSERNTCTLNYSTTYQILEWMGLATSIQIKSVQPECMKM